MNLQEMINKILSDPIRDWNVIVCWGAGSGPSYHNKFTVWSGGFDDSDAQNIEIDSHSHVVSLKSDLSIGMEWGITHNDNFVEEWANKFPDKKATSHFIDFFYNGMLVHRDVYVSVDGGRCEIPLPEVEYNGDGSIKKLTITRNEYNLFEHINKLFATSYFDQYISNAGIEIIDVKWPQ